MSKNGSVETKIATNSQRKVSCVERIRRREGERERVWRGKEWKERSSDGVSDTNGRDRRGIREN